MKKDGLFYVKTFEEASFFYIWCSLWKPLLMNNFIGNLAFYKNDFKEKKEKLYKIEYDAIHLWYNHFRLEEGKSFINDFIKRTYSPIILDDAMKAVDKSLEKKERIDNKECYIKDIKIPIASFSEKEYKWLKWHCPLDFVREQLKNDLGLKDYWFYKLFFKY